MLINIECEQIVAAYEAKGYTEAGKVAVQLIRDSRGLRRSRTVDTQFVEEVEDICGMGSRAWDMVRPEELIAAVLKVAGNTQGE